MGLGMAGRWPVTPTLSFVWEAGIAYCVPGSTVCVYRGEHPGISRTQASLPEAMQSACREVLTQDGWMVAS